MGDVGLEQDPKNGVFRFHTVEVIGSRPVSPTAKALLRDTLCGASHFWAARGAHCCPPRS